LDREDIPDNVRLALEIRQNGASAAVGKFASMLDRIGLDDVLRGMFLFRGAGPGRFSSVGTQIHNLLRQSYPQYIPLLKKHGLKGLELIGDPIKLLAGMVRPAFIPEKGKVFLVGDYAAIEARVLAWVSGAMTPLRAFRNNEDVYCTFGTKAYGRTITKEHDPDERFISKMVVLSLGYQGGEGALDRVLRKDNVFLSQKERQYLVDFYRNEFAPEVKNFWKAVSAASFKAIYTPGSIVDVGAVQFLYDGTHMWLRLPSERLICYPFAEIGQNDYGDVVRYQRGNRSPKKGESDWPMVDLYGGLLTENICQGIALDILVAALHNVNEDKRFLTRIHVHDEIVAEVQKGLEKELLLDFKDLMEATPEWARNIPIVSEVESFDRYVKG
jgi:DNA polymerase